MRHSNSALKAARHTAKIGNQTVIAGDCLKILQEMEQQSIDVIVTSPPYNLSLAYGAYDDTKDEAEYLNWLLEVAVSLRRILKPDGSLFLNIGGSSSQPWIPFELVTRLRSIFALQNHIVWVKSIGIGTNSTGHFKPISGQRFTHHNHEHVFHLTCEGSVALDRLSIGIPFRDKTNIARWGHARDLRCRGNTWFIPYKTVNSRAKKFFHPGTFPVELPLWCIYLHGKLPAAVLDPFVGSGTTLVAAQLAGAVGLGIDIDPEYVGTAKSRVMQVVEGAMDIELRKDEISELLKQDPDSADKGGFQGLLVGLQNRLNKTTGHLRVTKDEIERIRSYAFDYKNGGWQRRLVSIFGRTLGPKLDGAV